jgi:hypothetical protein
MNWFLRTDFNDARTSLDTHMAENPLFSSLGGLVHELRGSIMFILSFLMFWIRSCLIEPEDLVFD